MNFNLKLNLKASYCFASCTPSIILVVIVMPMALRSVLPRRGEPECTYLLFRKYFFRCFSVFGSCTLRMQGCAPRQGAYSSQGFTASGLDLRFLRHCLLLWSCEGAYSVARNLYYASRECLDNPSHDGVIIVPVANDWPGGDEGA